AALGPPLEAAAAGRSGPQPPAAEERAAPEPVPPPPSPPPRPASPPAPAPAEPAAGAAAVRVPAGKLDTFLARSGELLVARRRVQARVEDVAGLRQAVSHWRAEWRGVERPLAELLREGDGVPALPRGVAQALRGVGERL